MPCRTRSRVSRRPMLCSSEARPRSLGSSTGVGRRYVRRATRRRERTFEARAGRWSTRSAAWVAGSSGCHHDHAARPRSLLGHGAPSDPSCTGRRPRASAAAPVPVPASATSPSARAMTAPARLLRRPMSADAPTRGTVHFVGAGPRRGLTAHVGGARRSWRRAPCACTRRARAAGRPGALPRGGRLVDTQHADADEIRPSWWRRRSRGGCPPGCSPATCRSGLR